jgi:hypothetical protein
LYRNAIELYCGPAENAWILWKKLGEVLANAGRGTDAASAYLKAAESAPAAETLELKRLASSAHLISGDTEAGLALLRTILRPLGLNIHRSLRLARLSLIWGRARLRLRGLRFKARDASQISPRDLARIDLCWAAVAGLSMIEPVRGADFQTRGLLLALKAGERFRIARALAMEAGHRSAAGSSAAPKVAELIERAEQVAREIDSPHAHGIIKLVRGAGSVLLGQWKSAQASLDEAEQLFRNHCAGVSWERDTVHNFLLSALFQMGELAQLKKRCIVLYREAQDRGDRYAISMLSSFYMTMIKLIANESPDSEAQLEAAATPGKGHRFNLQNSTALDALIAAHLYRGDAAGAWNRIQGIWPEYARSMLLGIQMARIGLLEQRARLALAMAERVNMPTTYVQHAKRDARRLERERLPWALAHAAYVRAGIAACEEKPDQSIEEINSAITQYDQADMPLRAQLLRYRLGEVQNDNPSRALRAEAETWMRNQGIVSPVRWAGTFAPGFAKISSELVETSY